MNIFNLINFDNYMSMSIEDINKMLSLKYTDKYCIRFQHYRMHDFKNNECFPFFLPLEYFLPFFYLLIVLPFDRSTFCFSTFCHSTFRRSTFCHSTFCHSSFCRSAAIKINLSVYLCI